MDNSSPPPPPPSPPPLSDLNSAPATQRTEPSASAIAGQISQQGYNSWQADPEQQYPADYLTAYGQAAAGATAEIADYSYQYQSYSAPPAAPPAKRQKTDEGGLVAALTKIGTHIGNPKKFLKAAPLLRQLFTEGKLSGAHGDLVFECLKAAMKSLGDTVPQQTDLRKEYIKLFSIASNNSGIFSAREKVQLDVYGLLAVLRNQLVTDDSFVLNRILGRVKESIQHLPEASEEDDQVFRALQDRMNESQAVGAQDSQSAKSQEETAEEISSGDRTTWTEQESLCMKRHALISCLEAAKDLHSIQWARTSVEIAYEEALKHLEKFCIVQQPRVEALGRFAKSQRLARQQGRATAREDRRDRTAFETARKEWSQVAGISNRRAVGGGGDHHSEVWLG